MPLENVSVQNQETNPTKILTVREINTNPLQTISYRFDRRAGDWALQAKSKTHQIDHR